MKFKNRINEKINSTDGREFWISRSVALVSTIIAFKGGGFSETDCFILGVKRGPKMDSAGKYCLPCGYMDWDEDGASGAKREVWEETGLNVDKFIKSSNGNAFDAYKDPWKVVTAPELDAKQNISLYYGAIANVKRLPKLTFKNCDEGEVELVEWIPFGDYEKLDWAFNHKQRIGEFFDYFVESTK